MLLPLLIDFPFVFESDGSLSAGEEKPQTSTMREEHKSFCAVQDSLANHNIFNNHKTSNNREIIINKYFYFISFKQFKYLYCLQ